MAPNPEQPHPPTDPLFCAHGGLARNCDTCSLYRLASAASALLDAVVWRDEARGVEVVDLRGVTRQHLVELEEALP